MFICVLCVVAGLFYYIVWLSGDFGYELPTEVKESRIEIVSQNACKQMCSSTTGSHHLHFTLSAQAVQVFIGIVAVCTVVTLGRVLMLVIGNALYLSERKQIGHISLGRYTVPDSFFLSLRLSLQKLSLLLYLMIYLPVTLCPKLYE